jgi:hypothetical protein
LVLVIGLRNSSQLQAAANPRHLQPQGGRRLLWRFARRKNPLLWSPPEHTAIQIHGGVGYLTVCPVERIFRDVSRKIAQDCRSGGECRCNGFLQPVRRKGMKVFEAFERRRVEIDDGVSINCVIGGSGPPVLLLHGFPQNLAMWARVAPLLAEAGFTVTCADLRGYGDSAKPHCLAIARTTPSGPWPPIRWR